MPEKPNQIEASEDEPPISNIRKDEPAVSKGVSAQALSENDETGQPGNGIIQQAAALCHIPIDPSLQDLVNDLPTTAHHWSPLVTTDQQYIFLTSTQVPAIQVQAQHTQNEQLIDD